MLGILSLLSRLPFWFWYAVSDVLAWVAGDLIAYRKNVITQNLQRSFPDKSPEELARIRRAFYRNLSDVIVETIKAIRMSEADFRARVHYPNPELVNDLMKDHDTLLIMTAHQCNWEWMLLSGKIQATVPLHGVYQELSNPSSEKLMRYIRGRFGADPVKRSDLGRLIVKQRQSKRIYALVADQTPRPREDKVWHTFLNQPTAFITGAERLAKMMQAPVVFAGMQRLKRGHYQITLTALALPPYQKKEDLQLLENFAQITEKTIVEHPSDWLWSHRRWKLKVSDENTTPNT